MNSYLPIRRRGADLGKAVLKRKSIDSGYPGRQPHEPRKQHEPEAARACRPSRNRRRGVPASRCRSRPRAFYRCSRRHPWPSACTASYPVHFGTTAHPPTRTRNTSVTEFLPIHDFAGGRKGAAYKCKEMGENGEGSLEAGATSGEDFVIRYASTIEIDDFVDKDGIINEFAPCCTSCAILSCCTALSSR